MGGLATGAAYLVLLERKMAAWVQDRIGPNRVGIPLTKIRLFGLGQPLADGLKVLFKEDFTPAHVDRRLFTLAPILILVAALAAFAVIPFGSLLPTNFGVEGLDEPIRLVIAPGINIGVLYVFAVSSIAVYGVILGGWASNNKYSLLGGLRSSAQLIAYELPMGLGLLGVVVAAGSLDLEEIIMRQAEGGWYVLLQPLGFIVFVVAAFAEAARLPFDLPECEQELVGGYHTEYSGMRLLLFLLTEFLHLITAALLIVILFLGGWHLPFGLTGSTDDVGVLGAIARVVVLLAQGTRGDSGVHAGALELAAFSIRPVDGTGLEDHVAVGRDQLCGGRDPGPSRALCGDWKGPSGQCCWPPRRGECAWCPASCWPSPRRASPTIAPAASRSPRSNGHEIG